MQFSISWLREYVDLPDDAGEVARRLTAAGFAVDAIESVAADVVLEIDITTNRADCMNHFGLARELAVLFETQLRPPKGLPAPGADLAWTPLEGASVEIAAPPLCPRFTLKVIEDVTVGRSPEWLERRLESVGLRPINNVVDVTNFVLWELGQPQHAYDLATVPEGRLVVREAKDGEHVVTLDGEQRELAAGMLVIADRERPIGIAGIMGGLDTEVSEATRTVLLESAFFDPTSVRRTARRLGMHTDASHRFERGVDPQLCVRAAERAAALIAELGGGRVRAGGCDAVVAELPRTEAIRLEPQRLDRFAGIHFEWPDLERWFGGLGFEIQGAGEDASVRAPSWRVFDVERREDLYEEAMRIRGFDAIPASLPGRAGADAPELPSHRRRRLVREECWACGLIEAIDFAFYDADADRRFPHLLEGDPVAIANPLSERYTLMRRSLVPALLESALFNQRRGASRVRLFEIGHLFGAEEHEAVGIVLGGRPSSLWQRTPEADYFDLKGIVERLAAVAEVSWTWQPADLAGVVPGTGARISDRDGRVVGHMGRLELDEAPYPLFAAEILARALESLGSGHPQPVRPPSRFPGIATDLTVTLPPQVSWADLERTLQRLLDEGAAPDLQRYELKDRYEGPEIEGGAAATTLSFYFASPERSLTQDEVNRQHEAIAGALARAIGGRSQ